MIKQLTDDILNVAYRHISIGTSKYEYRYDINDQHNEKNFQFILLTDGLFEKQKVEGVTTLKLSGYIISFNSDPNNVISLQDEALHIFLDILEYVNNHYELGFSVDDYACYGVTQYSDNNCSGIYFTIQVIVPTPINLCEYQDHFIDKPIIPTEELIINNGDECTEEKFPQKSSTLRLNPLRL